MNGGPGNGRRLTILDLRDTYEIGGPGKTIIETFNAIDRQRFDLHLAVFARRDESDDTPFVRAAREVGMPVHVLRGYNQYDVRLVSRITELSRQIGADVIHAHEVKSDVLTWLSARQHRVATMTTLHGWIGNSPKQRAMTALDRWVVRRFDCVTAVSQQMWDQVSGDGYQPGQLTLLHNAIVIEKYRRTGAVGALAGMLGRLPERPILSSIGRLSVEKGQADLLEAVALVKARGRQVSVVLAGDGPARPALEAQARTLGIESSVFFPGYVAHPQRVLEETDLSVLPSHTEGLPNAALEAMAMQVPLLATRVGGTPEVVTHNETGVLVESKNPQALADGILDYLDHPARWQQMAAHARLMVERQFNFTTRTRALEQIYERLAARGGRA